MIVTITFNGPMKRPWPNLTKDVNLDREMTVEDMLTTWDYSDTDIDFLQITINGVKADRYALLTDGDQMELFLVVGGG